MMTTLLSAAEFFTTAQPGQSFRILTNGRPLDGHVYTVTGPAEPTASGDLRLPFDYPAEHLLSCGGMRLNLFDGDQSVEVMPAAERIAQ